MDTISCKTFDAALTHGEHNVPESLLGEVLPLLLQVTSEVLHIHILTLVSIKIKECARCSNKKIDR